MQAQSQVTTSLPAITRGRDGFEVLPATPSVQCWAGVDESPPPAAGAPTAAPMLTLSVSPQDVLMQLAKAVASATATLVLKAKNVAQKMEDSVLQMQVITAATQCALSTSQLVACTKVSDVNPCLGITASITWVVMALARGVVGVPGLHVLRWDVRGLEPEAWAASGVCHPLMLNILFGGAEVGDSCPCRAPTRNTPHLPPSLFSSPPGSGSHNQLPSLPGAADRGWQVGGQVGRRLCRGL